MLPLHIPARPSPRIILLTLALVAAGSLLHYTFLDKPGDLPVYQMAAERMQRCEVNYRPGNGPGWAYPPFQALFFIPLNHVGPGADRLIWYASQLAILALIVWRLQALLARLGVDVAAEFRKGGLGRRVLLGIIAAGGCYYLSWPYISLTNDLFVLLFLVLGLEAYCLGRDSWAGFWFGIGVACKLTPLLFLPLLIWQRRWRASAVIAATIAAATLLPDVLYPQETGELWGVTWYRTFGAKVSVGQPAAAGGAWYVVDYHNQSLAGTIFRVCAPVSMWPALQQEIGGTSLWPLPPESIRWLTLSAFVLTVGLLSFICWRRTLPGNMSVDAVCRRFVQGSAVICAMLLLSPQTHKSHYCQLTAPLAALLVVHLVRRPSPILASLLTFACLCTCLLHRTFIGAELGVLLQGYGTFTWCAGACFLGLTFASMRGATTPAVVTESPPQRLAA